MRVARGAHRCGERPAASRPAARTARPGRRSAAAGSDDRLGGQHGVLPGGAGDRDLLDCRVCAVRRPELLRDPRRAVTARVHVELLLVLIGAAWNELPARCAAAALLTHADAAPLAFIGCDSEVERHPRAWTVPHNAHRTFTEPRVPRAPHRPARRRCRFTSRCCTRASARGAASTCRPSPGGGRRRGSPSGARSCAVEVE